MLVKAGYLHLSRQHAEDCHGYSHRIAEVRIREKRYAVRAGELSAILRGYGTARIEHLGQRWVGHLGGEAGSAYSSQSGRGVIIELDSGERYALPAGGIRAVLTGSASYAQISEIASAPPAGWVHSGVQTELPA
ncbi:MAG: hypothetical protein APR53_08710 [Methanoculleus sp. SDB]|nr:MAG: hypothetical protein APR53_08710 [Methanoculleus sp. SDB]